MFATVTLLALAEPVAGAPAATGSRWGWVGTALQLLWVLFLFALVLWLAYFTTRLVGRRFSAGSGRYLRLVDSLPLGQNRAVALVELNGEVLCVGLSEHGVSLLGRFNRAELVELAPAAAGALRPADAFPASLADLGGALQGALGRWFGERRRAGDRGAGADGAASPTAASAGPRETNDQSGADEASEFARRMREQIERLRRIGESDRP